MLHKLAELMRILGRSRQSRAKLLKISPNTGTTLINRKIVIKIATTETTVGYIMADLTFLRSRAAFSR